RCTARERIRSRLCSPHRPGRPESSQPRDFLVRHARGTDLAPWRLRGGHGMTRTNRTRSEKSTPPRRRVVAVGKRVDGRWQVRSEEHTSELQSRRDLVCRLLLEKKKNIS